MPQRATTGNLVLSLAAFFLFMIVLLAGLGFGVGVAELAIWLVLLVVGALLIVRRFRKARAATDQTPT